MVILVYIVLIMALIEIIMSFAFWFKKDLKHSVAFMLVAALQMGIVYYVIKTSGVVIDLPQVLPVIGVWS